MYIFFFNLILASVKIESAVAKVRRKVQGVQFILNRVYNIRVCKGILGCFEIQFFKLSWDHENYGKALYFIHYVLTELFSELLAAFQEL